MYEHLLSIAEKIITNSAPPDISKKYYKLRDQIIKKYRSPLNSTQKLQSNDKKLMRSSSNSNYITTKKNQSQNSSINNKILMKKLMYQQQNQTNNLGARNRSISDINTKNMYCRNYQQENEIIYNTLRDISNILQVYTKKSQIELSSQLYSSLNKISSIKQSCTYQQTMPQILTISATKFKLTIQQLCNSIKNWLKSIQKDEIIEDNKWLIQNLQTLIKQNTILRRMVGKDSKQKTKKLNYQ